MEITVRSCSDFAPRQQFVANRSQFQSAFAELVRSRARQGCVVLDVGCGADRQEFLRPIERLASAIDGVDPSVEVLSHPSLRNRWHATLEDADLPENTYDLAFAYNVVEHIPNPVSFLDKIHRVLKPGGRFLALTPHAIHPFPRAVRLVEWLSLKQAAAAANEDINDYPAYYRLNSVGSLQRHMPAGFDLITAWRLPCRQWDQYFPAPLRIFPWLYDLALGDRVDGLMLLFAFEIQKAA
jgi:SAM-dependent methyltransferase